MAIGVQRDLDETRRQLEGWLATRLPAAGPVEVSELRAPWNGFSNETLLFDAAWRSADGTDHREGLVARVRPAAQVFFEYDLRKQYRAMDALAGTDVPAPRMRWYEEDPHVLGAPFFVMDRVEGIIPPDNPTYHVADVCAAMSPASRAAMWWDGIEKLARIHRLDWRAHFAWLDEPRFGPTGIVQQLGWWEHYLRWGTEGRAHPICTPALAWLRDHQPADEPIGVIWGDARIGNLIFRDDRCVAVLDWEMAALGNPEADLGWWLFLDWHHSAGLDIPRLAGFPSHEETIARWEALTGLRAANQFYYAVFAAFRFAVIMIRVATLTRQAGMPTPEDFDVNNICTRRVAALLELPAP